MDVVIVSDSARVDGGATRIAISAARGLKQAGVDVHFFAGSGPISPELEGIRVDCLNALPYNARPAAEGARLGLWDPAASRAFGAFVSGLDPAKTVVHIHSSRETLSASVPSLAIERGFRVALTCHEYLLGCPYGGFYDQTLHIRCPERGGSLGCWTRRCNGGSYAKKLWFNLRHARHQRAGIPSRIRDFIFVSEFSRGILRSYLPSGARTHIVENPVEVPHDEARPLVDGQPFLFVGHLHPGKDVVRFARAAAEADAPARFVGEGPMEAAIHEVCPGAEITGWVPSEQLDGLYRSSRALVFTPIWPETYGMVVYEAAARGLPSIVSDDCAPAQWVRDHDAGIVIDRDTGALKSALERLRDDREVTALGTRALSAFWARDRSLNAHVQATLAVYEQMLGS